MPATITTTIQLINQGRNTLLLLLASVLLLASCDRKMVYDKWDEIPSDRWSKDSTCIFQAPVKDSISAMNLVFGVRNTNAYPFSNLWLFITTISPDSLIQRDTFEVTLASNYGEWYGSGWGNLFTSLHYYKKNVHFPRGGTYTFVLAHGMREEYLEGVRAVGVRIEERED